MQGASINEQSYLIEVVHQLGASRCFWWSFEEFRTEGEGTKAHAEVSASAAATYHCCGRDNE
jgi:hypothetical protein